VDNCNQKGVLFLHKLANCCKKRGLFIQ